MKKENTALVFPGQGSQFIGMGYGLYQNSVAAKEVFQLVDEVLGYNLSNIIFNGDIAELTKTENAQPALMAVSLAVIRVLEQDFSLPVHNIASLVAGHSLGEYSALASTKSISIKEATNLLKIRGNAMAKCGLENNGAMAAVIGAEVELVLDLTKKASVADNGIVELCQIANDNSSGQIVISGHRSAIERAVAIAKDLGIRKVIILPVSGAFHSELMNNASDIMANALKEVNFNNPSVPVVANVTANIVADNLAISQLLTKQVTSSVRWRETMIFMQDNNIENIVEIGAGKVLCGLATRTNPDFKTFPLLEMSEIESFCKNFNIIS